MSRRPALPRVTDGESGGAEETDGDGTGPDRVRDHLGTLTVVATCHVVAVLVGLLGSWLAVLGVGYGLEGLGTPGGTDGPLVDAAFGVASLTSPVCFAAAVVLADLLAVRMLAGERARATNRAGLVVWSVAAAVALALPLFPLTATLSPLGWGSTILAPRLAAVAATVSIVGVVLASVAGVTVPLAVALDGRPLRLALRLAVAEARTAPRSTLLPVAPLAVGLLAGAVVALVGAGVLALGVALLWVGVGVLLFPVAFLLFAAAAFAFAAGHVRYRLLTIRAYRRRDRSDVP